MYLRFVITELNKNSGRNLGIFHAIYALRDQGKLHQYEETRLEELMQWFKIHLEIPKRFTTAKPPYYRKQNKAISWFKDTASDHIAHIREMAAILENHDIAVSILKTERVGYIVYEDDYQIVAEPFSDILC